MYNNFLIFQTFSLTALSALNVLQLVNIFRTVGVVNMFIVQQVLLFILKSCKTVFNDFSAPLIFSQLNSESTHFSFVA